MYFILLTFSCLCLKFRYMVAFLPLFIQKKMLDISSLNDQDVQVIWSPLHICLHNDLSLNLPVGTVAELCQQNELRTCFFSRLHIYNENLSFLSSQQEFFDHLVLRSKYGCSGSRAAKVIHCHLYCHKYQKLKHSSLWSLFLYRNATQNENMCHIVVHSKQILSKSEPKSKSECTWLWHNFSICQNEEIWTPPSFIFKRLFDAITHVLIMYDWNSWYLWTNLLLFARILVLIKTFV